MIKYTHYVGMGYVGAYDYDENRRTYMFTGHIPLEGIKPEIAAALKVAARIQGKFAYAFVDDTGNIVDAPA